MNRLNILEKHLVSRSEALSFDHFRNAPTIDRQEFKQVVFGRNWHWREKAFDIVKKNPQVFTHAHLLELSRAEMREKATEQMFKSKQEFNFHYDDYLKDPNVVSLISTGFMVFDLGFSVKNGVHYFLYMKTIFNLGTERHEKYIRAAADLKDIGCFGLTQFNHGSNVRGIQTQAHYDHHRRQFIINTPQKQGMKFWIGAAGEIANISVIWAQLYIDDKCYGVHAYIVPLRDKKTHKLLPGVLIGDCGPKNGVNAIDNGFILFDNVRIPVQNQLDRISGVNDDGKFFSHIDGEEKRFGTQLGALSGGRFLVCLNSLVSAMSALTIAIRYTCIRRQFNKAPGLTENLLIEYPLTKRRMMPLLAQAIVYFVGDYAALAEWDRNHMNILDPKNKVMQELHGISSIIKPKSGWFATECIRECRQMCGGHGYSSFNKLGVLYNDNDVQNTWEGDNNVLYQQGTKYVLDNAQKVFKGKEISSPILQFLKNPPTEEDIQFTEENFMNLDFGIIFLQYKTNAKMQAMIMKMVQLKEKNMGNMDIWNNSQVFLGKVVAMTLGDLYYLQTALKKLMQFKNQANKKTMENIIKLWMLRVYRYDQFVDGVHHKTIERLMMGLCKSLTYESLGLLESLSACDKVIGAPFACPEGRGMEKYIQLVENSKDMKTKPDWWKILKQKDV